MTLHPKMLSHAGARAQPLHAGGIRPGARRLRRLPFRPPKLRDRQGSCRLPYVWSLPEKAGMTWELNPIPPD